MTPELVEELEPDVVLVATGSAYLRPNIPGIDGKNVVMLTDAERDHSLLGKRVLVAGGGSAGLECALSLAGEGYAVTVADQLPLDGFANGMPYFPRLDLLQSLERAGVTLLPERPILRFTEQGAVLKAPEGEQTVEADTVVIALGVRRRTELLDSLRDKYAAGVVPIGDCAGGTNLYDATHTAHFAALNIT